MNPIKTIQAIRVFTATIFCCALLAFTGKEIHVCTHSSWGFFGHKKINELAVYTLPQEMFGFYKFHIDYLVEHSVDPDKRRYGVVGEAECHYIDMDRYADSLHPNPFENVPRRWIDAVAKYSEDTLRAHGIVPWNIYHVEQKLTEAFKKKDVLKILRLSAELGHYIGDAHVPLHTTSNYNGQKTGQRGIHGFWESRLPELYSQDYDFFVGTASYIKAPLDYIWDRIAESNAAVDSVLRMEKTLSDTYPADAKYSFETRGNINTKVYSEGYSAEYSRMLDGQVERRMKKAVHTIGSFWYTAWVNAGSPELETLLNININELTDTTEVSAGENNIKVREHE